ncbi:major facilitator superfamily domain-containing protein [Catenaria anguillulae PL171]|uniref:Lysosomal dipeptide transporter MFSD1 n=1 Tax=Catenaria anguillulae PL171 TaxID=765915 RepID=A0A1Y2HK95_9FUNG|nr:major facilitator superfamily domain-containing protein [Catenaria anguillulae PL171]
MTSTTNDEKKVVPVEDGGIRETTLPKDLVDTPLKMKIAVVFCASMIGFASHFAGVSFSALKGPLQKECLTSLDLKLTNSQYAVTQSSDNVMGTVLPLLAGFLYDYYGTGWGSLVTTLVVTLGNIFTAWGVTSYSYPLIIVGRLIYGSGAGSVNVVQQMIIAHWFNGTELASAMAALLTINRLGAAIGQWVMGSATPDKPFWYGSWITVGVSLASVLFNVMYVLLLKRVEKFRASADEKEHIKRRKTFTPKALLHLSGLFWIVIAVHFCAAGVMNSFMGVATDFMAKRDGNTNAAANYRQVVSLVVTAAVYPFMGPIVDRFGHRISFNILSNILLAVVMVLMYWTSVDSYAVMIIFAFTIPFKALASLAAIPIIVPTGHFGTSFAIYRCANSIATAAFDNIIGIIQDANKNKYTGVFIFFLCIIGVALALNLVWYGMDRYKYNSLLQKNNKEREEFMANKLKLEAEADAAGKDVTEGKKLRPVRVGMAALFVLALIATWVLYIVLMVQTMNKPAAAGKKGGK